MHARATEGLVQEDAPLHARQWTGSVSIAKAVHVWRLSSPTPETTQVEVEETMDGFLLTWFYGQKELDAEVSGALANLRRAAEGSLLGAENAHGLVLHEAHLLAGGARDRGYV